MGTSSTVEGFATEPLGVPPLDHQGLLTLARKMQAAATDCDCGHLDAAARDFADALGAHLRTETFIATEVTPGEERILRRGQVRLWTAASDLLAEADRGCPHSSTYRTSRAGELLALLQLQAHDEGRAHNHHAT